MQQRDGTAARDRANVSRQELYQEYVRWYLESCPEAGSFRDSGLPERAAHYLLREPGPEEPFTVFPFYQAVGETHGGSVSVSQHLRGVIKATELLETLCVNLFIQPWKKEFKTLKSYTGPFVYHLLPVLSRTTIQSVLASIGYLPHPDAPQSEYRLCEHVNMDRVILVGFELLLARVQCSHLLELLEKDQVGAQELLEFLQRRSGPAKPEEPRERRETTEGKQKEEEKKEEVDRKEAPLYSDTRLTVNPQPKPRRSHLISADQSIMEMQRTYPDLAFRGRPLVPDKPQKIKNVRSGGGRGVHAAGNINSEDIKVSELLKRTSKAAPTTVSSKEGRSNADENDAGSDGCHGNSSSYSDSGEVSGPQAMSLHITLRAGDKTQESLTRAESLRPAESLTRAESLRHAESLRPAESLRHAENQPSADNKRVDRAELPSLSSMDEQQELDELSEKMDVLFL
uniref:spermatogenesis-associated protein 2 isoform X3 n=1 Tax=Solea senegalensis TaxID=28829 RepID=UPI001CD86953|nr:spermatogenesis-associated protein 2 isoform X3 [Solea senegalensis]